MPSAPATSCVKHIFVLMLENRSFDHMLGFSELEGHDAVDYDRWKCINGLTGKRVQHLQGNDIQGLQIRPCDVEGRSPA